MPATNNQAQRNAIQMELTIWEQFSNGSDFTLKALDIVYKA